MLVFQGSLGNTDSHQDVSQAEIYFVAANALSQKQIDHLAALLNAQYLADPIQPSFLVLPRIGTISPWSSKATEIAKICGLEQVERIERGVAYFIKGQQHDPKQVAAELYDRMTESVIYDWNISGLFDTHQPTEKQVVPLLTQGRSALVEVNQTLGLSLSEQDLDYLTQQFQNLGQDPSYAELMMFAQVNSEHCRHKIFKASWQLDNEIKNNSLFSMIKNTFEVNSDKVLSAYHDNAAVIEGVVASRFFVDPHTGHYDTFSEPTHTVIKVETHNHPTAIAPFAGAATGSGGEIRDEGATGIGAKPKAGLCGFTVSNLLIPDFHQPWELDIGKPSHIASALQIMLEGPIGAASFNNEFGRPNLCGYFRTFLQQVDGRYRGYHKPIMIAGGLGNIRQNHIEKGTLKPGMKLVVLGGPAMLIGLGGGAASSVHAGHSDAELDFASVQRSNPEMQRRAQQVIDHCWALGANNPIVSIHDVGAGGLSNALPELVHDSDCGGLFEIRDVPSADPSMSPMEIWCNEAQERYVLGLHQDDVALFTAIAERERCPFAVVGEVTQAQLLQVGDRVFDNHPVNLPMSVLFADPPRLHRDAKSQQSTPKAFDLEQVDLADTINRVLHLPSVASKQFLITIGDRSVTGLVARDQMVGPWQVPVADCAVTLFDFEHYAGEAMSMGERPQLALLDPKASAKIAVAEALTNILAADIASLSDIKLSANWMAAAGEDDAPLYAAVEAVGMELCPALGLTIPVGKDSLSMRMQWQDTSVSSPVSLVISAFARVGDVRNTNTPLLNTAIDSELLLIDLGCGQNRLGGSALTQVYAELGDHAPNVDDPVLLKHLVAALHELRSQQLIHAYHDRSDGGLLVALLEMAFATHCGLDIFSESIASLFAEELGVVIQIDAHQLAQVEQILVKHQLADCVSKVANVTQSEIRIHLAGELQFSASRAELQQAWAQTSYQLQALRDDPRCAEQEFAQIAADDPGLSPVVPFEIIAPNVNRGVKPKVAILREQGVNGQVEMAAAFAKAGFTAVDVHMSDIIARRHQLSEFHALAACGGFSYGDVLGAGTGWANAILHNSRARDEFAAFFDRNDTVSLGVCNGCQMLSQIKDLIPGAAHWPHFVKNQSRQFEARLSQVKINDSPAVLLQGMADAVLPITVAHGEGRVQHPDVTSLKQANLVAMQYVDHQHHVTEQYPQNPNGSEQGVTALTSEDGRVLIMMPHPERVFRTVQMSWHPEEWGEDSPWLQLFYNARAFCG